MDLRVASVFGPPRRGSATKYIVAPGHDIKLGGLVYRPGSVIEILGRELASYYGDRLVEITDPDLIRNLEVSSLPLVVTAPFMWQRVLREPGEIIWAPTRSMAKFLKDTTRSATGDEILAWVQARGQGRRRPAAPGPPASAVSADDVVALPARPRRAPVSV